MEIQEHNQPTPADRLTAVAESLATDEQTPQVWDDARRELAHVADVLGEGEADDWAETAIVLGDLVDIAGCSLTEADGIQRGRLLECIVEGISLLRDAIDRPDAESHALDHFLETARRDWSDCLAVVDRDEGNKRNEALADDDTENREAAPSTAEVEMILSSLGGEAPNAAAKSVTTAKEVSKDLFGAGAPETGPADPPPTLSEVDRIELEPELLDAYLCDAVQCLASMEQAVLEYEADRSADAVGQLCRELHTLKGASASVGLENLGGYLHQLEEWLERAGTPDNLDAVLSCIDVIRGWVAGQQQTGGQSPPAGSNPAHTTASDTVDSPAAARFSPTADVATDVEDSLRVKASQVDRLMDLLADLVMLRSRRDRRVAQLGAIHEELLGCVGRLQAASGWPGLDRREAPDADGPGLRKDSSPGHPEAELTDHNDEAGPSDSLQPSPGEGRLSEISGDLTEVARALKDVRDPIADENRSISQFIRQFRHELMELRRMPVAGLFRRLQRAVRDAARVENKQVRLELVGEHAGLERSVQERLYEPLLHLVRNAVGHGIESEQERRAAGKEGVGTITLEAMGSAQLLVLEIRDDGRGLDHEAIRRRGIERGLISPDQELSRPQLAQLIFHPGFSTREQANAIAGRGVGMDVVATALRRMHARIDVESEAGQGTTVRLRIPLRSVIEHTMVFRSGGQLFALPVQSVRAATENEAQTAPADSTADAALPLSDMLNLPRRSEAGSGHCLVLGQGNLQETRRGSHDAAAGLVVLEVDEILGPDEVVVRSLPPLLRRHPLLAGATLSGGGDVVQLLDGERLLEAGLSQTDRPAEAPTQQTPAIEEPKERGPLKVLVVDDSLSARRSLMHKLRPNGFDLHEAGDGFEALDRLRVEPFDLVISDLEMPRMGGFDLLAEIRGNRKTGGLPVVIVTTRGEAEYRARADELGATGYLTKPVAAPELEQMLEQLDVSFQTDNPKGRDE